MGDALVTERMQMTDGAPDAGRVVQSDGSTPLTLGRSEDDVGHTQRGEHARPLVVDTKVGDEHSVDARFSREPRVCLLLGVLSVYDLKHQGISDRREVAFHTGDELSEERIGADQFRVTEDHEPQSLCAAPRTGHALAHPDATRVHGPPGGCAPSSPHPHLADR